MDQNTKQRLVGITVIFALAVIFLPMILDGSGVQRDTLTVDIPIPFELHRNPEFEQKIVELHANVDDLPSIQMSVIDEQSKPVNQTDAPNVAIVAANKTESNQTKKPTPEVLKEAANTKAEERAVEEKAGGESYVLQVGSFNDQNKAILQRDKLRKSKIAAVFIEKFDDDSNSSYRVRLGPFVNKNLSTVAFNKVKAKYNITGLIMEYKP